MEKERINTGRHAALELRTMSRMFLMLTAPFYGKGGGMNVRKASESGRICIDTRM